MFFKKMKPPKSLTILAVILLAALGLSLAWVLSRGHEGKLVLRVPWGEKKGELGFLPHSEHDEDQGPMSFFVTSKNQIYVLDTVNRRINVYSGGSFSYDMKLQIPYYPHDLLVDGKSLYVLTDMTIAKLDAAGKPLKVQFVGHKSLTTPWSLHKQGEVLVVKLGEGLADELACFTAELRSVDCSPYERLYRQYDVVTFTADGLMVVPDGDRIQVRNSAGTLVKKSRLTFSDLVSEEVYPRVTAFRVVDDMVYSVVPDGTGVSFYEFKL